MHLRPRRKKLSRQAPTLYRAAAFGRVSFSMYVFHFIIAWGGGRWLAACFAGIFDPDTVFAMLFVLTIFATWKISYLSEQFVEAPGPARGSKLDRPRSPARFLSV
jgi:peptidoglycan/LPS O-acetylase OafA/YrhL